MSDTSEILVPLFVTRHLRGVLELVCLNSPCDYRTHQDGYILHTNTGDADILLMVRGIIPLLAKVANVEATESANGFLAYSIQLRTEYRW